MKTTEEMDRDALAEEKSKVIDALGREYNHPRHILNQETARRLNYTIYDAVNLERVGSALSEMMVYGAISGEEHELYRQGLTNLVQLIGARLAAWERGIG
jgi:hypothetical protein